MSKKSLKKKIIIIIVTAAVLLSLFCAFPFKSYAIDAYGRALGIDVSSHNGTIDWDKVKNSGIDFAIIRIGYGDNEPEYHDTLAQRNMSECERVGIPYGVYLYSYSCSMTEADSEVAHVLTMIQGHNPVLGLWYDMEDADGYKVNRNFNPYTHGKELTDYCLNFIRKTKAKGYNVVGVYANKNYFTNILDYNAIKSEGLIWLAHWGISSPSLDCAMWQWADDGSVPGSSTYTDMDYIYPGSPLMAYINQSTATYTNVDLESGRGDVNNDGEISATDYVLIKNHIMETSLISDAEALRRADVNGDKEISASDYVLVKNYIMSR